MTFSFAANAHGDKNKDKGLFKGIDAVLKDLLKPDHRLDASFCFQRCWLPQQLDRWDRAVISHSVNSG